MILRDRQNILRRGDADLRHPLRIDIQPARTLLHNSGVKLLPFFAQEPVHENLERIRMGRILNDPQYTVAAARASLPWASALL